MKKKKEIWMPSRSRKIAILALMTSLAVIAGYIEMLIPLNLGIPGIKPGICNIVILFALYQYSWKEALMISVMRILIIGFLFGNGLSIAYSLGGTVLAIAVMSLLKRYASPGILALSISGAASHGIGQLIIAGITLPALPFSGYAAMLIIAGIATGTLTGLLTFEILKRTKQGSDHYS